MGNFWSSAPSTQAKYCLYQKEDFQTMLDIIKNAKEVTDNLAEMIYKEKSVVPDQLLNYSQTTKNYFYSVKDTLKISINELGDFSLSSVYKDIELYNQIKVQGYNISYEDKIDHIKKLFLKSKEVVKILLNVLTESCEGNIIPGYLNKKTLSKRSIADFNKLYYQKNEDDKSPLNLPSNIESQIKK